MEGRDERSGNVDPGPSLLVGRHAEPLAVFAVAASRRRASCGGRSRTRVAIMDGHEGARKCLETSR
jgi:hypothetical protein